MGSLPFRFDTLIIPFLVYSFNSFIVHFYEQSVNFIKNALLSKPYTAFAETFSYKKRRRTLEKTVARANGERILRLRPTAVVTAANSSICVLRATDFLTA